MFKINQELLIQKQEYSTHYHIKTGNKTCFDTKRKYTKQSTQTLTLVEAEY